MIPLRRMHISERWLLILLAMVQFTHIMDFMIMMPLAPQLMRELSISTTQFSILIAAYTITAGIIGLLVAPFVDRYDRRTVLVICYAGFRRHLGLRSIGDNGEPDGSTRGLRCIRGDFKCHHSSDRG